LRLLRSWVRRSVLRPVLLPVPASRLASSPVFMTGVMVVGVSRPGTGARGRGERGGMKDVGNMRAER